MEITTYGTRGSAAVSGPENIKYGGNTTCVQVQSDALPKDHGLFLDMGTGIIPAARDFINKGGKAVYILSTHYHHDHQQGFPLSCFAYMTNIPITIIGAQDNGFGPEQMLRATMKPPLFPVDYERIASHINCIAIKDPMTSVILIHPRGGLTIVPLSKYTKQLNSDGQVIFTKKDGGQRKYNLSECAHIHLHPNNHPDLAVALRITDPSGKVFCFVTDHENQPEIPLSFRRHLADPDLLLIDTQYDPEKYKSFTAGFGHSTPIYSAKVARTVNTKKLGLTHHDPLSTDEMVDNIAKIATEQLSDTTIEVFACRDYMSIKL